MCYNNIQYRFTTTTRLHPFCDAILCVYFCLIFTSRKESSMRNRHYSVTRFFGLLSAFFGILCVTYFIYTNNLNLRPEIFIQVYPYQYSPVLEVLQAIFGLCFLIFFIRRYHELSCICILFRLFTVAANFMMQSIYTHPATDASGHYFTQELKRMALYAAIMFFYYMWLEARSRMRYVHAVIVTLLLLFLLYLSNAPLILAFLPVNGSILPMLMENGAQYLSYMAEDCMILAILTILWKRRKAPNHSSR